MIRLFFLSFCLLVLFFTACQKAPLPEITNACDGYCSYTVGSYWIYQHVTIDSNNIERILTTRDTVSVIGDSIINGNTYAVLRGKAVPYFNNTLGAYGIIGYVRDSLHYLVYSSGVIGFSSQDFNSTLHQADYTTNNSNPYTNSYSYKMEDIIDSIDVPAGTFKVLDYQETATSTDSSYALIFAYKNKSQYYAKGVGKVLQNYVFYNKIVFERRLLEYHIE